MIKQIVNLITFYFINIVLTEYFYNFILEFGLIRKLCSKLLLYDFKIQFFVVTHNVHCIYQCLIFTNQACLVQRWHNLYTINLCYNRLICKTKDHVSNDAHPVLPTHYLKKPNKCDDNHELD